MRQIIDFKQGFRNQSLKLSGLSMRNYTLLFFLFLCPLALHAQEPQNLKQAVGRFERFFNEERYDSIYSMFSAKARKRETFPKMKEKMERVYGSLGKMSAVTFDSYKDSIYNYKLTFKKMDISLKVNLTSDNRIDYFRLVVDTADMGKLKLDIKDETVVLQVKSGKIYGTLTAPVLYGKIPLVILIPDSGPVNRDGNAKIVNMNTNAYKMLAEQMSTTGIAFFRYDKRGVGESAASYTDEKSTTLDTYIDDAVGFINQLGKDKRFSEIIILGHGEGALVGMVAAQKTKVKKYISLEGAGYSIDKILKVQLAAEKIDTTNMDKNIFDSIRNGYTVTNLYNPMLKTLFRPSFQPFMRSWIMYDPTVEIKKLKIPVLLLQGERDLSITTYDVKKLKEAVPTAAVMIYKNMNHVLKDASPVIEKNKASYSDPGIPLNEGLVPYIYKFINE